MCFNLFKGDYPHMIRLLIGFKLPYFGCHRYVRDLHRRGEGQDIKIRHFHAAMNACVLYWIKINLNVAILYSHCPH